MKDVIVVVFASAINGTLSDYVLQLSSAGIPVHIEDLSKAQWLDRGAYICEKIDNTRALTQRFSNYQHIVFSDGFDVTFYGKDRDQLLARLPKDNVLHAAEKNYYPKCGQENVIPDRGPWRFVNGGLSVGTPAAFWQWCDDVLKHRLYRPLYLDQHFMNMLLADESALMAIDHETKLFFCLHSGYNELEFVNGEPVNRFYDSWPLFIHANGKWPAEEMFRRYHESL